MSEIETIIISSGTMAYHSSNVNDTVEQSRTGGALDDFAILSDDRFER